MNGYEEDVVESYISKTNEIRRVKCFMVTIMPLYKVAQRYRDNPVKKSSQTYMVIHGYK